MRKLSIGIVNCYGKEVLESTGRVFDFSLTSVTSKGVPIMWEVSEVLPEEKIALVQSDCDTDISVGE